jgi:hypothetical protein
MVYLRHYLGICLKELRKITKVLSKDSLSPSRSSDLVPSEYKNFTFSHGDNDPQTQM